MHLLLTYLFTIELSMRVCAGARIAGAHRRRHLPDEPDVHVHAGAGTQPQPIAAAPGRQQPAPRDQRHTDTPPPVQRDRGGADALPHADVQPRHRRCQLPGVLVRFPQLHLTDRGFGLV